MELRPIVNFPGYKIFSNGYVWSAKRNKFLIPSIKNNGYLQVGLWKKKKRTYVSIHRLVLEVFIGPCWGYCKWEKMGTYMVINEKQKWPTNKARYDKNWIKIFGLVCEYCKGKGCPSCNWLGGFRIKDKK